MTKEEIRKLLGGYATNTLTESERNALFEAALDDQELFDALQQEQVLKNVLDDPSSRAEIQQALEHPNRTRSSLWIWGGTIGAATAAAVLVAVFWPRANVLVEKSKEIVSLEESTASPAPPAPAPPASLESHTPVDSLKQAPQPAIRGQFQRPPASGNQALESNPSVPTPAPIIPPPVVAQEATRAQQQQERSAVALSQRIELRDQSASARARSSFAPMSSVANLQTVSLRYSLVKQDPTDKDGSPVSDSDLKPGDRVRLRVAAEIAGRIVLQRLDAAGVWQTAGSVAPEPHANAFVPSDPIVVTAEAQRLRLTFEPNAPQTKAGTGGQLQAPAAPSSIEITIVASAR